MSLKTRVQIAGAIVVLLLFSVVLFAFDDFSESTLIIVGNEIGTSKATLLFMALFVYYKPLKFCLIAKAALTGLLLNHVLFTVGGFIDYETYGNLYTIVSGIITIPVWVMFVYFKKK